MKKTTIKFLLLISLFLISGCVGKHEGEFDISVSPGSLTFESDKETQHVTVTATGSWSISGIEEWLTLSEKRGSGDMNISIEASKWESTEDREATLIFRCGDKTARLEILQFGVIQTNYIDMKWEDTDIISYDETDGKIVLSSNEEMPQIEVNKAIILPAEYLWDIRVVKNVTVSGSTVTIDTEQGNMSHLFMDTQFTLATDPSLANMTRSSSRRIITPSEIGVLTENGYEKLMDKETMNTRVEASVNLVDFNLDRSGDYLYSSGGHNLLWERCVLNMGLKGVFYFDFGKKLVDDIPWGDIREFDMYLDGSVNMDLLLKYAFNGQLNVSRENLLHTYGGFVMTFPTTPPIIVITYIHTKNRFELSANARVTMSAGVWLNANARMGLNWRKGVGVSPIHSFNTPWGVHHPTFTAIGSVAGKASFFPKIEIGFYKFLGPWFEIMPYIREDVRAGMRASTDGNNYMAWRASTYGGLDFRAGLNLNFGFFDHDLWTSPIYNPYDVNLFDAPRRIELVSHNNDSELKAGQPVNVNFHVSSLNNITGSYYPCLLGLVNFKTSGELSSSLSVSNSAGIVTVTWTPKDSNDYLTAEVVDENGAVISSVTLSPKIEEEPITGLWAGSFIADHGEGYEPRITEIGISFYFNSDGTISNFPNGYWSLAGNEILFRTGGYFGEFYNSVGDYVSYYHDDAYNFRGQLTDANTIIASGYSTWLSTVLNEEYQGEQFDGWVQKPSTITLYKQSANTRFAVENVNDRRPLVIHNDGKRLTGPIPAQDRR